MLSQIHNNKAFSAEVKDILQRTAEIIIKEQKAIASTFYNRQTGFLISKLSSNPYQISGSLNPKLVFDYPKYIRFLDLKKTGRGITKESYHPIYNTQFFGLMYGYAYPQIRYGLAASLNEATIDPLKEFFSEPIEIQM